MVFTVAAYPNFRLAQAEAPATCFGVVERSESHRRGADIEARARVVIRYCEADPRDNPSPMPQDLRFQTNGRDGRTAEQMGPDVLLSTFREGLRVPVYYLRGQSSVVALTPQPRYLFDAVTALISVGLTLSCLIVAWRSAR